MKGALLTCYSSKLLSRTLVITVRVCSLEPLHDFLGTVLFANAFRLHGEKFFKVLRKRDSRCAANQHARVMCVFARSCRARASNQYKCQVGLLIALCKFLPDHLRLLFQHSTLATEVARAGHACRVTDPCDCRVAMYGSIWADRSVHLASRESGHERPWFVALGGTSVTTWTVLNENGGCQMYSSG